VAGLAVVALLGRQERPAARAVAAPAALPRPAASAAAAASAASLPAAVLAAAAAVPASAPLPAFELPADLALLTPDEGQGWRALAAHWKLAPDDADTCAAAQRVQLQCYRGTGASLTLLRQLDRPVLLLLRDAAGRPGYAVLSALGPVEATLQVGGQERRMALVALEQAWRGEFSTLWRTPPGYAEPIGAGSTGPAAEWVSGQFANLPDGLLPVAAGSGLRTRIQAFQAAHGLAPDGLAGPVTLMQLNRVAGVDEPRLQTRR
jgi:general secretion pathway protein A